MKSRKTTILAMLAQENPLTAWCDFEKDGTVGFVSEEA